MCIRDRRKQRIDLGLRQPYWQQAVLEAVVEKDVGKAGADPVSYTHLRAHETVLDLVCRLLLEKKNSTKAQRHC